jgi:hypothetical protein
VEVKWLDYRWKLSGWITHIIKKLLMGLEYRKDYYVLPHVVHKDGAKIP